MIARPPSQPCGNFGEAARQGSELVIRGRSMKTKMHLLATLLSLGFALAQTDIKSDPGTIGGSNTETLRNSCAR